MQKTDQPLLSICILTFNRAEILRKTLAHLAETLDTSTEIVVSNNCSSDHTVDVLEDFRTKWERFRYVRLDKEIPMTENAVVAGSMATGKYMYLFCDDDRIVVEGINKAVKMMQENDEIIGVFGSYAETDPTRETVETYKKTDEVVILPKGLKSKKIALMKFGLLWSPVIRTEPCQRFCITTFDKRSFGHWHLLGKMLDYGAIAVIPDVLYHHVQTVPRCEFGLTEGWYHDMYHADLEVYLGKMGNSSFRENAALVGEAAAKSYLQGVLFSKLKGELLTGRHFLLRARAYGLVKDETVLEYERAYLKQMVVERLNILISAVPGVRKVILESHPISQETCSLLGKVMPEMEVYTVSREELLELPTKTENFIVALDYQTLLDRGGKLEADPLHQCSLKDVFANCRLFPGEITFD